MLDVDHSSYFEAENRNLEMQNYDVKNELGNLDQALLYNVKNKMYNSIPKRIPSGKNILDSNILTKRSRKSGSQV